MSCSWRGLPPIGISFNDLLLSAIVDCERCVKGRGPFYIGVTSDPLFRFWGDEKWKHHHSWGFMVVLAVSTAQGIMRLERAMLADKRVGLDNHYNKNKGEGGEGVRKDADVTSPYFLYVVAGKAPAVSDVSR